MVSTAVTALLALSLSTAPVSGGLISHTTVPINTSAGDQYDPHVDGDLAAYSSDLSTSQQIRYYRYSTGVDSAIDNALSGGGFAQDLLSDVNQGRIVFTRVIPSDRNAIFLFDTNAVSPAPVEIAPEAGSNRIGVALGGNSLLFADFGLQPAGELVHVDLGTNAVTRLTNDLVTDQNPAVAPDGSVLAWEKCPSGIFNCEVWIAVKASGAWVASTFAPVPSSNPDTNGSLVVYEATRAGSTTGADIFMRPVAGGAETPLEIAGRQSNPSIRGDVIAFESRADGALASDIFLYDLASNTLYQLTATDTINETLNDVTVLPSGEVRIVWNANDDPDGVSRNIYSATFALPAGTGGGTGGGAGGGGGSGGGAGGGGGSSCQPQSIALTAQKDYSPTRWTDADVSFPSPVTFALPPEIAVTSGNAGNHYAILTLHTAGGCQTMCKYRGGANQSHPHSAAQIAAGLKYEFDFCTGQGMPLHPGSLVEVDRVQLHIDNGDNQRGTTAVAVTLAEVCGATPVPLCGGSHHDGDDDDDDDDGHHGCGGGESDDGHGHHWAGRERHPGSPEDVGTSQHGLNASSDEPLPAMGCSSTSGGLVWPALLAMVALLALRGRPLPIRIPQRQERRKLRR